MYYLFLVLLILDGLLLAAVVLLQSGQGGGLASLGGGTTDLVVGGRQAANLLTRLSWWCGGVFLFLSLVLSILAANRGGASSEVLDRLRTPAPATTSTPLPLNTSKPGAAAPVTGSDVGQPAAGTAAPAAPATQKPKPSDKK
jgi:preprotein translocase subunit SecG